MVCISCPYIDDHEPVVFLEGPQVAMECVELLQRPKVSECFLSPPVNAGI